MVDTPHSSHLLLVTLALYLGSCTTTTAPDYLRSSTKHTPGSSDEVLLNSERIEKTFGSYAIEILAALDNYRLSNLYSAAENIKTTRTLALVKFSDAIPPELADLHQKILTGASIGAAFKRAGWHISKEPIRYDTLSVDAANDGVYQLMRLQVGLPLAMQVYAFNVMKGQQQVHYANIVEIYHPEYIQRDNLPNTVLPVSTKKALSQQAIRAMLNELMSAPAQ